MISRVTSISSRSARPASRSARSRSSIRPPRPVRGCATRPSSKGSATRSIRASAATLALIAAYERSIPWMRAGADTPLGARIALWGGREVVALVVVSLAAGTATMPYVAFHFHRLGPYGVLANLMAMPIVSIWVMPAGLLALLALAFGFDARLGKLMGLGIEWMIWVALFVAGLPGAVGRMTAFGTGPLLLCSAGLVVLCLLRSPLRWAGAIGIIAATLCAMRVPRPDVYVADRGD